MQEIRGGNLQPVDQAQPDSIHGHVNVLPSTLYMAALIQIN